MLLTLFVNWCVKPFTMLAIASFFLGTVFLHFIGPEAVDLVKLPFGLDPEGARPTARARSSCRTGSSCWRFLFGGATWPAASCWASRRAPRWCSSGATSRRAATAHTLVMVAINSLTMLVLYGVLGGFLLGVGRLPVPWQALLLSIGIYVALPLVAGFLSRKWIIAVKGEPWFREKFLHVLTPITIGALLLTLVLLFSFKGDVILANPLTILWIAVPLVLQTLLIFGIGYALARVLRLRYADAAPTAMIGASNHFEVAIATAVMLFGLSSGAALATVVGVLIEVPLMLALVRFCLKTQGWFPSDPADSSPEAPG